ncbi:hypothetical protein TRFO_39296 [Tritrichomonas foetus]|uniref:Polymorphic outer membrane protein n=1 Tax=Tritrichomonas foetus TaxID=1144522 RepID=A0A1J4J5N1_9EUKA|nr:hypothetical protein TRFO_39296 [Tritrichomonas foetus]|eukprot:OHS94542.1 hypothetical protein TRFO_39296 [Tritrichomonas foetus]
MFLYTLVALSYEIGFHHLQCNESVISGLSLKKYTKSSPFILFSSTSFKSTTTFHHNTFFQFYSNFARSVTAKSMYFSHSNFMKFLDSAVVADAYREPNFKDQVFATSQTATGINSTFLLCTFTDIISASALVTDSTMIRVYTCEFTRCGNTANGGAIQATNCRYCLVNDCDFSICTALISGGAVYCRNAGLNVFRNSFMFCQASLNGGAFFYEGVTSQYDLRLSSNFFFQCTAVGVNSSYYYISFNATSTNSIQIYFNKYECNQGDLGSFTNIISSSGSPVQIGYFRNAYGINNINVHILSTETFSPLPTQTPTNIFTHSNIFSASIQFTESMQFTASGEFTLSSPFSPSLIFTASSAFTPSIAFTPSLSLVTASPQPTGPSPSISQSPTQSNMATPLPTSTPNATPTASPSNSLPSPSPSQTPFATETPTISRSPLVHWPELSLGLIILAGILLLIGIIANIYLISLCCRPSEILAQQIV